MSLSIGFQIKSQHDKENGDWLSNHDVLQKQIEFVGVRTFIVCCCINFSMFSVTFSILFSFCSMTWNCMKMIPGWSPKKWFVAEVWMFFSADKGDDWCTVDDSDSVTIVGLHDVVRPFRGTPQWCCVFNNLLCFCDYKCVKVHRVNCVFGNETLDWQTQKTKACSALIAMTSTSLSVQLRCCKRATANCSQAQFWRPEREISLFMPCPHCSFVAFDSRKS